MLHERSLARSNDWLTENMRRTNTHTHRQHKAFLSHITVHVSATNSQSTYDWSSLVTIYPTNFYNSLSQYMFLLLLWATLGMRVQSQYTPSQRSQHDSHFHTQTCSPTIVSQSHPTCLHLSTRLATPLKHWTSSQKSTLQMKSAFHFTYNNG